MRKISKILTTGAISASLFLSNAVGVFAQQIDLKPEEAQGLTDITAEGLITGFVKLVLVVAALVFFFVLVIGGIQWIISGGDKTGAETARKRITNALIGLAIVFVAWAIGNLLNTLFGFDIFSLSIPSF